MKGMLKKLLIMFMLITVFNTSLISGFSNATMIEPYLTKRNNGLSEEQRLAIVNAGNYLQTSRFPFLIYCLDGANSRESFDFNHSCSNGLLMSSSENASLLNKIKNSTSSKDIFTTSCAYYCCYIYKNVLGLGGAEYSKYFSGSCMDWINKLLAAKEEGDSNCPLEIVDGWNFDELMPGDIIIYSNANWNGSRFTSRGSEGHAMLYLGKNGVANSSKQGSERAIAHASGHNINIVTSYESSNSNLQDNKVNSEGSTNGVKRYYTIRINPEFDTSKLECNSLEIFDEDFGRYVPNALKDFTSNGLLTDLNTDNTAAINYGKYTSSKSFGDQIIDSLSQVIDVILGFMILPFKVIVIGWSGVIQQIVTTFISASTGVPSSDIITVEKIVYNQVPLLDANFFNLEQAGGEELTKDSVIYMIRSSIATWYNVIRGIGIAGMLVSLLYMGIRMALSSISEEKAKYKKMIKDWAVSFIILMSMHYIMIAIVEVNNQLLNFLREGVASESSLYEQILLRAYDMRLSVGLPSTLMYIVLVVFSALYFVTYLKRFFTLIILTIFSPIIAISYAIDKVKDGKSQSFSGWLKEYIYTVIIQSIHALLYVIFVSTSINMALGGMNVTPTGEVEADVAAMNVVSALGNLIPALVFMIVSLKLEDIFKSIFNIAPKGMDDVVAEKEDILGYLHISKRATNEAKSFAEKGYNYFVNRKNAKDTRLDIEKQINPKTSMIEVMKKDLDTAKQEISDGIDLAKTIVTSGPAFLATKALELPLLRDLYKIRHPIKFHNLKKFYANGGNSVSETNANLKTKNRTSSQIKIHDLRNKIQFGDGILGIKAGINELEKNKEVDKVIKKIATGKASIRDLEKKLEKYGATDDEKNAVLELAKNIEEEKQAKIKQAKEEMEKKLYVESDVLDKVLIQKQKSIQLKKRRELLNEKLKKLAEEKSKEKGEEVKVEDLKNDKKIIAKLDKEALLESERYAKSEIRELKKKEKKEIIDEVYEFAIQGIDRRVGEEIKADLERVWEKLNGSD